MLPSILEQIKYPRNFLENETKVVFLLSKERGTKIIDVVENKSLDEYGSEEFHFWVQYTIIRIKWDTYIWVQVRFRDVFPQNANFKIIFNEIILKLL